MAEQFKQKINSNKKQDKAEWGYLVTKITDSGTGIKRDMMKDIFRTFKKKNVLSDGIGIGLSTARALAVAMGGIIYVSSQEGKGSSVTFAIQMRNNPQKISQKLMAKQNKIAKDLLFQKIEEELPRVVERNQF